MNNPFETITDQLTRIENKLGYIDQIFHRTAGKDKTSSDDELLTTSQAAELLGIAVQTLYGKIQRKELPLNKPPGCKRVYFYKKDLVEFIRSGRVKTSVEVENEASESGLHRVKIFNKKR